MTPSTPDARPSRPAPARHPAPRRRLPVHLLPDQRRYDPPVASRARCPPRERTPRSAGTVAPLSMRHTPRTHGADRRSGLRPGTRWDPPAAHARRRRFHGLQTRRNGMLRPPRMGDALSHRGRGHQARIRAPTGVPEGDRQRGAPITPSMHAFRRLPVLHRAGQTEERAHPHPSRAAPQRATGLLARGDGHLRVHGRTGGRRPRGTIARLAPGRLRRTRDRHALLALRPVAWGLDPILVETPRGRAEFVAFQREWIARTQALRSRYLRAVSRLEALSDTVPAGCEATAGQTG